MRIGITQRVEEVASYKERRDCLDQQWFVLLEELGLSAVPIPNSLKNVQQWLKAQQLQGVILSGGNDLSALSGASNSAKERDQTEFAILNYFGKHYLPVLGVCRGLQMINIYLEGQLIMVEGHVATRHSVKAQNAKSLFSQYKEVNSFHGWGFTKQQLGKDLVACLVNESDDTIEAVHHKSLPWTGIMWHPEREYPFNDLDKQLIKQIFKNKK